MTRLKFLLFVALLVGFAGLAPAAYAGFTDTFDPAGVAATAERIKNERMRNQLQEDEIRSQNRLRDEEIEQARIRKRMLELQLEETEHKASERRKASDTDKPISNSAPKSKVDCRDDCKGMFIRGELKTGMTVNQCIKVLCK